MADRSAEYAELPRTAYMENTLRRARTAAEQRSHRYVTLEHLLLALMDDPDALALLRAVGADVAIIQSTAADTVNNRMLALVDPAGRPAGFSYKFDSLFAGASNDAIGTGRRQVDGALALIAVAKDRESAASGILAANGFEPQAALRYFAAAQAPAQPPQPAASQQAQAVAPQRVAPAAPPRAEPPPPAPPPAAPAGPLDPSSAVAHALSAGSSANVMEDMLASVRNILDAEERKERGLPPAAPFSPPPPPAPVPRIAPPRLEPKLSPETGTDWQRMPLQQPAPAPQPSLGQRADAAPRAGQRPAPQPMPGFSEMPAPSFDLETPPPVPQPPQQRPKKRERRRAGQGEPLGLVAKILQTLPRKGRRGVALDVQIVLTREEAASLFARAAARGQPQLPGSEAQAGCRAVTIRLSAPEGGLFIEPTLPETQWMSSPPGHAGEAFGAWAWMAMPGETGRHTLVLSISARDTGANGTAGVFQVPDQTVKIRVGAGPWRVLWGLFKALFLLSAGSALTVAALYVLKMSHKVPDWFFLH
jgi:hypothetical protein